MLVKFTDVDNNNDEILVESELIVAVTEKYTYDDDGDRVKADTRMLHLKDHYHIEVQESIDDIQDTVNNEGWD